MDKKEIEIELLKSLIFAIDMREDELFSKKHMWRN